MFQVHCLSPLDDEWELRDVLIRNQAGRPSNVSCADRTGRQHIFYVPTLTDGMRLRDSLNRIAGVTAFVREP